MDETLVICGYCTKNAAFDSIIQHLFDEHSFRPVKYREWFLCDKTGTTMLLSKLIQVQSPAPTKLYSDQTSKSSRKSLFKENVLPVFEDENQQITDMVDMLANIV